MSVILLDKIRRINNLLHDKSNAEKVVFSDICKILGEILNANVFVLSKRGKILGVSLRSDVPTLPSLLPGEVGQFSDTALNERLLNILSTKENMSMPMLGFEEEHAASLFGIASPIDVAGERHGTLLLFRSKEPFTIDDIIISEYATTVVGLEIMRSVNEESAAEVRNRQNVRSAINTLSFSELSAVREVVSQIRGIEGVLVASKIADEIKITRSIIVNALRKLASAGIIESRSSGMKGTYVKIVNPYFLDILESSAAERRES
ncbi:MAG: GTP-sensing pleiotropic transcriptional regulator CodY [Lachnospiraceae bacterium]|nr:GTP-sensing pleiotropic transcriptional regulator CodY [Lachnospiraceae bacterium]